MITQFRRNASKALFSATFITLICLVSGCSKSVSPISRNFPLPQFHVGEPTWQGRISTNDPTNANADYVMVAPGEIFRMPAISGPGEITHLWLTGAGEPLWEKYVILNMYWDDAEIPAVRVPVGDFFLMGDGQAGYVNSLPIKVTKSGGGHNSYFAMPFKSKAVIEIENQGTQPFALWMHIDYHLCSLPRELLYFHASYRQAFPTKGWGDDRKLLKNTPASTENIFSTPSDFTENYTIADIKGRGLYIGSYLLVSNRSDGWSGEGDERIFVDGESAPRYSGTGMEDYFNNAFGLQRLQTPLFGVINTHPGFTGGVHSAYRFHFEDPIEFDRSLYVSIEHGAANSRSDDYASVAYFYLNTPQSKFLSIPPPGARLTDEMKNRLIVANSFEQMAVYEREGRFDDAVAVCNRALDEIELFYYVEPLIFKKGWLLFRAGWTEQAQIWLENNLARLSNRQYRQLAVDLLEFLESQNQALAFVYGDDNYVFYLDNQMIATGDYYQEWTTHAVDLESSGSHDIKIVVHNLGSWGRLAFALFYRDGQIITGDDWLISEINTSNNKIQNDNLALHAKTYDYPAHPIRNIRNLNPFHFIGADIPWIWGQSNFRAGETLYFYKSFKTSGVGE